MLGIAVLIAARTALQQQVQARIDSELSFLGREYSQGGLDHLLDLVRTRGRGASALDYLVQARDGRHLAGEMPTIAGLRPGWMEIVVAETTEDGGRPERDMARVVALDGGALLAVGTDLGQLGDVEEAVVTAFAWTVSLAALLGIGGGVWLSRAFLRRVDAIARTAEGIIAGDLTRRVPTGGTGDDLDRLAATLNRMLDRIATLMESLHQVSSDVAHDLRTPLTRLYQRLEEARASASTITDYEAAVDSAVAEADGLLQTFASLLRIAQVEGASPTAGFTAVDLSALAETVADAYQLDIEAQGYRLATAIDSDITIRGDRELLTQAFANVVENALRHTPPGTLIRIELHARANGGSCISVSDNGPGVSADDLPKLVLRFYRGEHSRTTPGSGLGLSLAHAVAELHGACLEIGSLNPGLRVQFVFPAFSAQ
ncbi:MAG TPA: ATP-binding protein [Acetobacteraceae bacterium]